MARLGAELADQGLVVRSGRARDLRLTAAGRAEVRSLGGLEGRVREMRERILDLEVSRILRHAEPGGVVDYENDFGKIERRRVERRPWRLDSGRWLVRLEGRTGGVDLGRCEMIAVEGGESETFAPEFFEAAG